MSSKACSLHVRTRSANALQRNFNLIVFLILSAIFPGIHLVAQVSTASVVGTVTDTTGAVIPNAKVTVTNLATGVAYNAVSNSDGDIAISQLPVGHYSITADAPGFEGWKVAEFSLLSGDTFRVTPKLTVGATTQVVQVTAAPTPLQTDTSNVSSQITEQQTQNLPVPGRNVIELTQYTPGATDYKGGGFSGTPDDQRRDSTISINGRTGAENNFLIDGQDDNERFVGTVLVKPSEDGIATIQVVSNSPEAELSRASGATIVFTTKGGGNAIHGTAYEFFENQALNAFPQNTAPGASKPTYTQNNYGGSIGGPIKKNKIFYFGDFETYTSNQGTVNISTVPTDAMRQGIFTGVAHIFDPNTQTTVDGVTTRTEYPGDIITPSDINSVAQTVINLYPEPNIPGAGLNNNFSFTTPRLQTDRTVDTRFDFTLSPKNSAFIRYNWDEANTTLPYYLPDKDGYQIDGVSPAAYGFGYYYGDSGGANQIINSAGIIDTLTLSENKVLILRAGYGRYQNRALPRGFGTTPATQLGMAGVNIDATSSGFPDLGFPDYTGMGAGNFYPTLNTNNSFSYGASFQILKGNHLIKMGEEFIRRQVADSQSQEPKIGYYFTSSFTDDPQNSTSTGYDMASFLLGYPAETLRVRYLILPGYRTLESGAYIEDDYRVKPYLTLNLGFRYDYYSPLSEAQDRISNFDYPDAKVIVAGQDGISNTAGVTKDYINFGPRVGFSLQLGQKTLLFGGFGISYVPTMLGTPGAMRNAPFISNLDIVPDQITPINSISDPVPALVPDSTSNPIGQFNAVDLNYRLPYVEQFNLSAQRQLPFGVVLTTGWVASLGKRQSGSNNSLPLNGAAPGAALVQTRRPLYAEYPNLAEVETVKGYYTDDYESWQTSLKKRETNGMTFTINYTWSHDINNSQVRYYAQNVYGTLKGSTPSDIRNRVSAIWVYQLPSAWAKSHFVSVLVRDWSLNAIATWETGLPFSVTQVYGQTNGADGPNLPNQVGSFKVANPSAAEWFNPSAFAPQPNYTWGDEGVNKLNSPGTWDMDLGLHRSVVFHGRYTLQFRAEAFDFTNTRHPNAPNSTLGSAGFGTITTYNSNRTVQLAVKFLF